MNAVLLVGTSHKCQIPGTLASKAFQDYLRDVCTEFSVSGIGEEMNSQALAEKNSDHSVGKELATELEVAHRYCDPDLETRKQLGIMQENDIRAAAWPGDMYSEQVERDIRASYAKREQFWLQQLLELASWPLLFICGATHILHFKILLEQAGIEVEIVSDDWAPQSGITALG